MKNVERAREIALAVTLIICVVLGLAFLFHDEVSFARQGLESRFKVLALAIGPVLAVLGFFWGRVDKAEIKQLSRELGISSTLATKEQQAAAAAKSALDAKVQRIANLERDLATVADASRLWKLRPNDPFQEYRGWKFDPLGAKIVTMALFKGGVGKTHLAANFAAYVSEKQQKPVLLIDLDYQGSLSTTVLSAAGIEPTGSNVDALFDAKADLATLSERRIHLANHGSSVALNGGRGLARAWLVPAEYSLAEVESRLLIERVLHDRTGLDERYRLAHLLLHPSVRREYAMILLDTPPRMTLGTVNALVASHCFVLPTILDQISSEAVRPFLMQLDTLRKDLALDLRLAGIVATMTRQDGLAGREPMFRDRIIETAQAILGREEVHFVSQNLPRKVQIGNFDDLGYFLSDGQALLRERFYDPIFDDLWTRIMSPRESS